MKEFDEQEELESISKIDWSSLTASDKEKFVVMQLNYVNSFKKFIYSLAVHRTDVRSLLLLLFSALIMSIAGISSKTLTMSLLTIQFVMTVFSKLSGAYYATEMIKSRDEYLEVLSTFKKEDE